MEIALGVGDAFGEATGVPGLVDQVQAAADLGFPAIWTAQLFGLDALTALAVAGARVPGISVGTAVVPTYPRHPIVLAGQALTVQSSIGNRLTLGIGLSHRVLIERVFGYDFARPARHMREYLAALGPLLRGEAVKYRGETLSATATVAVPGAVAPSLVVAALGPVMLDLTGELADGTVTWMTGPATVADHIVPTITAAASRAGRPAPRVIVGLPFCVTGDPADARARAATQLARYALMPSYRAMLDREGAGDPADIVVAGDEEVVRAAVRRVSDAGATEVLAVTLGTPEEQSRTRAVLADIAAR